MGPRAVDVSDSIVARELPTGQRSTAVAPDVRVGGEGSDSPADEERSLGVREVRVLLDGVTPVVLADPEVVEDGLGPQEPRRQGQRGHGVIGELDRHGVGQTDGRHLAEVVEELTTVAVKGTVGDFDDQPPITFEHQGHTVPAGDDVGVDRPLHHLEASLDIGLPEALVPFGQAVPAPDVIDQDLEFAMVRAHAFEERGDGGLVGMVGAYGDSRPTGGGDQFGGFLDRLRPLRVRRSRTTAAAVQ